MKVSSCSNVSHVIGQRLLMVPGEALGVIKIEINININRMYGVRSRRGHQLQWKISVI